MATINDLLNYVLHTPNNINPQVFKMMASELEGGNSDGKLNVIYNKDLTYDELEAANLIKPYSLVVCQQEEESELIVPFNAATNDIECEKIEFDASLSDTSDLGQGTYSIYYGRGTYGDNKDATFMIQESFLTAKDNLNLSENFFSTYSEGSFMYLKTTDDIEDQGAFICLFNDSLYVCVKVDCSINIGNVDNSGESYYLFSDPISVEAGWTKITNIGEEITFQNYEVTHIELNDKEWIELNAPIEVTLTHKQFNSGKASEDFEFYSKVRSSDLDLMCTYYDKDKEQITANIIAQNGDWYLNNQGELKNRDIK